MLLIPPLMHGAAQWGVFNTISTGGWIALPDDVKRLDAAAVLRLANGSGSWASRWSATRWPVPRRRDREGRLRPLRLDGLTNGGATLSPTIRGRLPAALPNLLIMDAVGASESARR